MNITKIETARTIIDSCYIQKITHNKYLSYFSLTKTNIHLKSYY